MKAERRSEYVPRDTIVKLLSDEEVARVSTAKIAIRLADGDEYIDLPNPERATMGKIIGDAELEETHGHPRGEGLPSARKSGGAIRGSVLDGQPPAPSADEVLAWSGTC